LLAVFATCLAIRPALAQEGQPGAHPPAAPGTAASSGADKKYVEMSHSKDRVIKATAERYLDLVKFQEWGGASGKKQMAKYVSHDPDLKQVKLSIARGTGKDRVVKEFDIDVEKLDKTGQARVKQIDKLQKRLDELSAADAAKGDGSGGPGRPAPMASERAAQSPEGRGPEGGASAPPAGPDSNAARAGAPAAPAVDPSASEPDPLGFAELPPVTPTAGSPLPPGIAIPPTDTAAGTAPPAPGKAGNSADRKQWKTSLAAFTANISVAADPAGKPLVNWGALRELGEINDIVVGQRSPEPPARSPEAESPAAISEKIGDLHWQLVVDKVEDAPGGLAVVTFHPVDLPKPLEFRAVLDDTEDVQKWVKVKPGAVPVSVRLSIPEPYKILAKVKLADAK
jgi:hypothetical protein